MNSIFLQSPGASSATTLIMMVGMILVFYFFMIRPQTKKAKEQKNFINNLQKGDKVVTIGGVHGKITEVGETFFMIEIDNNVRIKIDKTAVSAEASKQYRKVEDKK